MKAIKKLIAVIGMMALLATSQAQTTPTTGGGGGGGGGQPPCGEAPIPNQLPISVDDIQARAWESVAGISVYGWVSSSINATINDRSSVWSPYSPAFGSVDVEDILATIKAYSLQLSTLYTSDQVGLGSSLCDKNGNDLLYGNTSSRINPPKDGISKNTLDLVLTMSDSVLLSFPNAVGYRIVERDGSGNPIRYYDAQDYDVRNGKIRFYNYFADKNGEIIVQLCDGTEVAYGLGNQGQRIIPTTVQVEAGNVSALGTRTFRSTYQYEVLVNVSPEEYSANINPLSQLIVDEGRPRLLVFSAWVPLMNGAGKEHASTVRIWPVGKPSSAGQSYNIAPDLYTSLWLSSGHYWVKFEFASGWPNGNQFYPPYQPFGRP